MGKRDSVVGFSIQNLPLLGLPAFGWFSVPRANLLADIASKEPMPHFLSEFQRHSVSVLNGEVADAP